MKNKIVLLVFSLILFTCDLFCDDPSSDKDLMKFALAIPGILTENNYASHDTLEVYPDNWQMKYKWINLSKDKTKSSKEMLKKWWGIDNKNGLNDMVISLKNSGHSLLYMRYHDQFKSLNIKNINGIKDTYEYYFVDYVKTVSIFEINPYLNDFFKNYDRYYDQKKLLLGWDLGRIIFLARECYQAKYIDEKEAWDIILPVARELAGVFDDWEDFGTNYILGRMFWQSLVNDYTEIQRDSVEIFYTLTYPEIGPWSTISWYHKKNEKITVMKWINTKSTYSFMEEYRAQSQFYQLINNENLEGLKVLLDRNSVNDEPNWVGYSPVFIASGKKNEILSFLIEKKFNIKSNFDSDITPLMNSIVFGNYESFNILIKSGVNINDSTSEGYTPLMFALLNNKPEFIRTLLEKGAECRRSNDEGWTPLMYAAKYCSEEMTRLLLTKDIDINAKEKSFSTALTLALEANKPDVALLLIDKGADCNYKDKENWTPLFYALTYCTSDDICRKILSKTIDLNSKNDDKWTPLMYAVSCHKSDIAALLIEKGVKLDEQNVNGWTALMLASQENDIKICKLLIAKGADMNTINKNNKTALDIAVTKGYSSIVDLLRKSKKVTGDGPGVIKFTPHYSYSDFKITSMKGEKSGDSIKFTFTAESSMKMNYSFFNPPSGTKIMLMIRDGISSGVSSYSFSVKINDLEQAEGITIKFWVENDEKNDNYIFLDINDIRELIE
jgi:ankyrin repeat protein